MLPAKEAVMFAEVEEFTPLVVTAKVAEVNPDGTVTEAGTMAAEEPEERETTSPEGPAPPDKVTLPVAVAPPTTEVGVNVTVETAAGVIVRRAVWETLLKVAVRVTGVLTETPFVLSTKDVEEDPDGTVTEAGVMAAALVDCSVTTSPALPATLVRCTVTSAFVPPTTELGDAEMLATVAASRFSVAVSEVLPKVAVMVTAVLLDTGLVLIRNEYWLELEGTVTIAGTETVLLFD